MAKMRTPAMEKYDRKRARRKGKKANPKFDAWRRFTRNRTAIVGLCILVVMMIFVIGAGGGSPMDAAKAIALMVQNRDTSEDILYKPIKLKALPVVEVPTTCGTGSEVTPYAILTRDDIKTKQSISHKIYPVLACIDAKYLESAPAGLIINTAIDALGHLVESYFNTNATEYSRMASLYGMENGL